MYFIADSAEVTVLRTLASSAFGKYQLTVPDDVDIDDVYDFAAPDNELGYVAALKDGRVGGMFRRFVRNDVKVTSKDDSDDTWFESSDVDKTLTEARDRVESDFFLESDITLAGLGPFRPFVDFTIGDIAHVDVWGMVVDLPVTRIEPIITDHSVTDWKVHVGGQLMSDEDSRVAENRRLYDVVARDRRQLSGVQDTASKAVKAAGAAQSSVDSVRQVIGGRDADEGTLLGQLAELNRQLKQQGVSPKDGLLPAYIDTNTRLWQMQQDWNRQQEEINRQQKELSATNERMIRMMQKSDEVNRSLTGQLRNIESGTGFFGVSRWGPKHSLLTLPKAGQVNFTVSVEFPDFINATSGIRLHHSNGDVIAENTHGMGFSSISGVASVSEGEELFVSLGSNSKESYTVNNIVNYSFAY